MLVVGNVLPNVRGDFPDAGRNLLLPCPLRRVVDEPIWPPYQEHFKVGKRFHADENRGIRYGHSLYSSYWDMRECADN